MSDTKITIVRPQQPVRKKLRDVPMNTWFRFVDTHPCYCSSDLCLIRRLVDAPKEFVLINMSEDMTFNIGSDHCYFNETVEIIDEVEIRGSN